MKASEHAAVIAALTHQHATLAALATEAAGNTRLEKIVCAAIPVYNAAAAIWNLPQISLPAFCTTGG